MKHYSGSKRQNQTKNIMRWVSFPHFYYLIPVPFFLLFPYPLLQEINLISFWFILPISLWHRLADTCMHCFQYPFSLEWKVPHRWPLYFAFLFNSISWELLNSNQFTEITLILFYSCTEFHCVAVIEFIQSCSSVEI